MSKWDPVFFCRIPARLKVLAAAGVITLAALAAYHNTFRVPFFFDDQRAILENPNIRRLWPVSTALWPTTANMAVSGRPVANFTLALNYALSGSGVWSYHAFNLLIHLLGGLTLFGVVRRTLLRPGLQERFGRDALPLAWLIALLWTLHPLQTEAVTYVIQRVESLMGLFFLLTFYCFIRSVESPRPRFWQALTVATCLLGMASKEVMVTAPLLVLLYDRAFVAGSLREAWRRRWGLYLVLAATWFPLLWLVAGTGWNRGGTAGFNVGVVPWAYWLTQFEAVARYLRLSAWPHPLVFEYGTFWVHHFGEAALYALVVVPLAAATLIARWRWPALGFLGTWFFMILAPTSVVPGTMQMIVEHRMYLPLAAVITLAVLGVHAAVGRRSWLVFAAVAVGLGVLTARRNADYRSELTIWGDTVAKRPDNARARNGFGLALDRAGRLPEAIQNLETASRLLPGDSEALDNLGVSLEHAGRNAEAIQHYEAALRLKPGFPEAHNNLGNALLRDGRIPEAIGQYQTTLRLRPDFAEAYYNLAGAFDRAGRTAEAIQNYETALRLKPDYVEARINLGNVLHRAGRNAEAIRQYETALKINPEHAMAHYDLGVALDRTGRTPEAIQHYVAALRLQPDLVEAHNNLGVAFGRSGRFPEAIAEFRAALRLRPDYAEAHYNLGNTLVVGDRWDKAIVEYEEALRAQPDYPAARENLAMAREQMRAAQPAP
jgi:tetratricopeptide (TPR) repeat protein